ncbi:tetratricopeptide repeat protein [Alcanivorax sp. IO_7]|nr:tetratricopeptide repeat protein [Alcanivorax sp. IO_7]
MDLWRSNVSLALAWSEHAPASVRAQRSAAIALVESGNHEKALAVLNRAYQKHPGSHSILMHRMILKCSLGVDITKDKINLLRIAREEPFNPKLTNLLSLFVDISTSGKCTQLNSGYTELLLSGLLSNATAKESEGFLHQLFYFKGVVYSHGAQSSEAERYFVKAIRLRPGWGC